jgi:predicted HicB family RNase H-like nuclease
MRSESCAAFSQSRDPVTAVTGILARWLARCKGEAVRFYLATQVRLRTYARSSTRANTGYDGAMARQRTQPAQTISDAGESDAEKKHESAHSGRLLLRMPQSLHAALAHAADTEGVSLNQFITSALASAVGWRAPEGARPGPDEPTSQTRPSPSSDEPRPRGRSVALTVNLIVLLLLAILAIVLVLTAWHQG